MDAQREQGRCDECRSLFFYDASHLPGLCPECAHWLYGYPNCKHSFVNSRCEQCGWDGSTSPFIEGLKQKEC